MSTILVFGAARNLLKQLFALDIVPMPLLASLRDQSISRVAGDERGSRIQTSEQVYFLSKFQDYWKQIGHREALLARDHLARRLVGAGAHVKLLDDRESMQNFVRAISSVSSTTATYPAQ